MTENGIAKRVPAVEAAEQEAGQGSNRTYRASQSKRNDPTAQIEGCSGNMAYFFGRKQARSILCRLCCLLLCLFVMCTLLPAAAQEDAPRGEPFPELNEKGFLDEGEFLYENEEEGVWRYCSQSLRVEIIRRKQSKPRKQIWYEAEVWADEDTRFDMIPNDASKRMSSSEYPYIIARKNRTVLAITSDFAQMRVQKKMRVGILLRDGEILSDRTYKAWSDHFPNLDTLAIMPDGEMRCFNADELEAQEYVDMGCDDVLAFGPVLIRDGELNTKAMKKYGTSSAQRTAIGMVEKGHYFAMMLEGRRTDSKGDGISFLAEKLLERGCQVAFNLDGGQTSGIIFMGHQICHLANGKSKANISARKTAEIIGIGTSELVADLDDEW